MTNIYWIYLRFPVESVFLKECASMHVLNHAAKSKFMSRVFMQNDICFFSRVRRKIVGFTLRIRHICHTEVEKRLFFYHKNCKCL